MYNGEQYTRIRCLKTTAVCPRIRHICCWNFQFYCWLWVKGHKCPLHKRTALSSKLDGVLHWPVQSHSRVVASPEYENSTCISVNCSGVCIALPGKPMSDNVKHVPHMEWPDTTSFAKMAAQQSDKCMHMPAAGQSWLAHCTDMNCTASHLGCCVSVAVVLCILGPSGNGHNIHIHLCCMLAVLLRVAVYVQIAGKLCGQFQDL